MKKDCIYPSIPKPLKGWQRVLPGRVIKKGDKWQCSTLLDDPRGWIEAMSIGKKVRSLNRRGLFYIRKISND